LSHHPETTWMDRESRDKEVSQVAFAGKDSS
jgi:hypothetical protein